ncbi:LOW QUALITY PROTEIN: hypothetical protein CVT26_004664, partial [Gymnopilus dilepis]
MDLSLALVYARQVRSYMRVKLLIQGHERPCLTVYHPTSASEDEQEARSLDVLNLGSFTRSYEESGGCRVSKTKGSTMSQEAYLVVSDAPQPFLRPRRPPTHPLPSLRAHGSAGFASQGQQAAARSLDVVGDCWEASEVVRGVSHFQGRERPFSSSQACPQPFFRPRKTTNTPPISLSFCPKRPPTHPLLSLRVQGGASFVLHYQEAAARSLDVLDFARRCWELLEVVRGVWRAEGPQNERHPQGCERSSSSPLAHPCIDLPPEKTEAPTSLSRSPGIGWLRIARPVLGRFRRLGAGRLERSCKESGGRRVCEHERTSTRPQWGFLVVSGASSPFSVPEDHQHTPYPPSKFMDRLASQLAAARSLDGFDAARGCWEVLKVIRGVWRAREFAKVRGTYLRPQEVFLVDTGTPQHPPFALEDQHIPYPPSDSMDRLPSQQDLLAGNAVLGRFRRRSWMLRGFGDRRRSLAGVGLRNAKGDPQGRKRHSSSALAHPSIDLPPERTNTPTSLSRSPGRGWFRIARPAGRERGPWPFPTPLVDAGRFWRSSEESGGRRVCENER